MSVSKTRNAPAASVRALRQSLSLQLAQASDSPQLDTELLLCKILDWPRARLIARSEHVLDQAQQQALGELLKARQQGQPMAYLLGEQEFWSLNLKVSPDVLVPRPDTEALVAWALENGPPHAQVLDLGTGSGAIAIALASEKPAWHLAASDASESALRIARENAERHRCSIEFRHGSWLQPWAQHQFDLIVSNPPYLADDDPHLPALKHEPSSALIAPDHGLADFNAIIRAAPENLKPQAWLALEHGFKQAADVRELLRGAGFQQVATRQDLAGRDRISYGQKP